MEFVEKSGRCWFGTGTSQSVFTGTEHDIAALLYHRGTGTICFIRLALPD